MSMMMDEAAPIVEPTTSDTTRSTRDNQAECLPSSSTIQLPAIDQDSGSPSLAPPPPILLPSLLSPFDGQELNIDCYASPEIITFGSGNDERTGKECLDLNELGKDKECVDEPRVGMVFDTLQDGYDYYCKYARDIGFRVRKQRSSKRKTDRRKVVLLTLVCACEGYYTQVKPPKKKRPDKRFGCKAMIEFKLIDDEDKYIVRKFVTEHSHKLVPYRSSNVIWKGMEHVEEPRTGMVFDTLQDGYDYYNTYAKDVGFRVRKCRSSKSTKDPSKIILATLCCSCEGFYTQVKPPRRKRQDRRFGCKAMIDFKPIGNEGKYIVDKFISEHSHELVPCHSSRVISSQSKTKRPRIGLSNKMHSSGLKEKEIGADARGAQHLDFIRSDCNNLAQRTRALFPKKGDVQYLFEYLKQKKQENKHFVYSFRTNEDYEISGVFFCDAKSRRDYGLFGDAVCFDTTFMTNNYDMVCAPIVGINNHGQTTLFGCGLLDGETTDALIWLFNTFLEVMGGKKPISIFTNQSMAIANAISVIFPESHHGLCLWHIYQNATKHLSKESAEFKSLTTQITACIYDPETVEEFEQSWNKMLDEYGLGDNDMLHGLYQLRKNWAQVYNHGYFSAGITTTQRSESINNFLEEYFGCNTVLREFVDQYAKAMSDCREKERTAEYKADQASPVLISDWSIEREAAREYTKETFVCFQEEYRQTIDHRLQLETDDGAIRTYQVTELGGQKKTTRILAYNNKEHSLSCTCRKFESDGIICSHSLKLFRELDYACLPPKYYLKRWTREITDEVVLDPHGDVIQSDIFPSLTTHYGVLSHILHRMVSKGLDSEELFSVTESAMLEAEAKIDAWIVANKEKCFSAQKSTCNNEDAPMRDPPMSQSKGQPGENVMNTLEGKNKRKKSKTRSGKAGNRTIAHITRGASNIQQGSFGLIQHPSYCNLNGWNYMHPRGSFPQGICAQDPRGFLLPHYPSDLFMSRTLSSQPHSRYRLLLPKGQNNVPLVSTDILMSRGSPSQKQVPSNISESQEQSKNGGATGGPDDMRHKTGTK